MSRTVELESSRIDARYVAEATLETGKTITSEADWYPHNWSKVEDRRNQVVYEVERKLAALWLNYGLKASTPIRVYLETRAKRTYTETNLSRKFASEHAAGVQK